MDGVNAEKKIKPVISNDITGKLMIQSAREIPLSTCFGNLCCFDGSECYFETWPELTGTTFREACYCFNGDGTESNSGAVVMGVKFTDDYCREMALERPVQLNPPGDYDIRDGDKILVLAEDNDTYHAGTSNETPATPVPPFELPPPPPENILLCCDTEDPESGEQTEGLSGDSKVMVSMLIFRELQRIKAEEAEKAGLPKPP